ncbi:C39 family peptidase [Dolichospermum circinale CS-537/03]|uniref:C39 family peptidase n=4 Tax=Dolichospermum circinale TaxID=109265 RepID=UPI00232CC748|nr:C39 family peptidase [Dolichospermum circinale]MDB9477516.1 C39 family peptidase [Dolichospermum circinale CS-537/03]
MMKSSKFLTTLSLTIVLTVSGVNIIPFTSASFNDSKAEAAITIRNDYVWMDMPQTGNQNDNWSCGPTSAARVMNFYGHNVNRGTLVGAVNKDFVIPPSFTVRAPTLGDPFRKRRVDIRTGTTPHALRDVMKRWEGDNVKLERKADFNKLLGLLRQGKPVIVLLRVGSDKHFGTTWPIMHWVVVNGFSASEQKIYFTETEDGKTYEYSYGEFQSNWDWRVGKGLASEALHKNGVQPKTMIWVDRVPPVVAQSQGTPSQPVAYKKVFIKSAHGNYFLDHRISDRSLSLADQPYNPATGAYDGELWEIVDAGGGRVLIKSDHGNYFLDHRISDRSLSLADQPYNPATGAYDGELWEIVDAGGGRVLIKSAHGNYFLDHRISDRSLSLADQPYNPATGAYDGELWVLVPR